MTPNADLERVIEDLECLAIDPTRLCRSGHRVVNIPAAERTCPADFPTWDRHPCGAEFHHGWWVGEVDDDVPAILNAAVAALKALAPNDSGAT
jgi:hypothetical protein